MYNDSKYCHWHKNPMSKKNEYSALVAQIGQELKIIKDSAVLSEGIHVQYKGKKEERNGKTSMDGRRYAS